MFLSWKVWASEWDKDLLRGKSHMYCSAVNAELSGVFLYSERLITCLLFLG